MVKLLGGRGATAVMGFFMLALGSSEAAAQNTPPFDVSAAVKALDADQSAKPLGTTAKPLGTAMTTANPAAGLVQRAVATTTAVASSSGAVAQVQPARSVTVKLQPSIATEAAWLYRNGWPLYALVDKYSVGAPLDEEANCLATAVYFEARGETVEGQLAVARVVMNRAASGKYPATWCATMKQPWQFSFVNPRTGTFPSIDIQSASWARAQGVARVAIANVVPSVGQDVLWYHATYVAPSWGRRLSLVQRIGTHIFYRA